MANLLLIVWGVALLAILALGGIVLWTQASARRGTLSDAPPGSTPMESAGDEVAGFRPSTDALLLYYEEEATRSALQGDVVLRIPGIAWEPEWQEDLVRLEVSTIDPDAVVLPGEWGPARVLAAYSLRGYRMTEIGTDIPVAQFAAPIDVFLLAEGGGEGLRFGVKHRGTWRLAPPTALSAKALAGIDLPADRSCVAASIAGLGQVCLFRFASGEDRSG
jgi:hypothetical protein